MIKWWIVLIIGIMSMLFGVFIEKVRYYYLLQDIIEVIDGLIELLKGDTGNASQDDE